MIRKLLIANRGEIACRILRTCRDLGIATCAVYSDVDADAPHVRLADEAVHLGAAPASASYLNIDKIVSAALRVGADAVHPGYGFLAENAAFAQAVINAGLIFIGPPPNVIARMGSKIEAKRLAEALGVPVVPGYAGEDQRDERLTTEAERIGYPIMIKASAGGGGKGMREVQSADALIDALAAARREARAAFGDDALLLEKRILRARHIEIQIFGDPHGHVIALGERECSLQRRHQKIIEETPSPAVDATLYMRMSVDAVQLGKAMGYINAGTVEFIVDADGQHYFLEVNTRLQVEHPVTELRYEVDLVARQIAVAEGASILPLDAASVLYEVGHAIEARLYAEDVPAGYLPSSGDVLAWAQPMSDFVRVDSGIEHGTRVGTDYDPLLAKIIAWGETRAEAIRRLDHALSQVRCLGLRTNRDFLRRVLRQPDFAAGAYDTGFLDRHAELLADPPAPPAAWATAALAQLNTQTPAAQLAPFRNNPYRPQRVTLRTGSLEQTVQLAPEADGAYRVHIGSASHIIRIGALNEDGLRITLDGHQQRWMTAQAAEGSWWVSSADGTFTFTWVDPLPASTGQTTIEDSLRAPMPGSVIAVPVSVGQAVAAGDVLVILEAMKMEHRIRAPGSGVISRLHVRVGQTVPLGAVLAEIDPVG